MFRWLLSASVAAAAIMFFHITEASAATCPSSPPAGVGHVLVNTTPASTCLMYGSPPPNITGDASDVFLNTPVYEDYETIAFIPAAGGTVNGFTLTVLGDKSGTFDATGVTGFTDLVLGLKNGNLDGLQWGVFLLGNLTGTWGLYDSGLKLKDLSHAVLYGIPVAPVPLPGALLLFGTTLVGWFGFSRLRKRLATLRTATA